MRKAAKVALVVALLWIPLLELCSYFAGAYLASRQFLYVAQDASGYEENLKVRDPVVGWPSPSGFGKDVFDATGSRIMPAHPTPDLENACVAMFGDSFTFGDEVEAKDSYPNVVARELGCRVNNFGVGGYGSDQAFLRYRDVVQDRSKTVVLAHFSENIIRNVNQFRDYIGGARFGLKPRFVIDGAGNAQLVPLPKPSVAEFERLAAGDSSYLEHEYFRPGGDAGIRVLSFPFTLSVVGVISHYRMRAWLKKETSYAAFYAPDHPSKAVHVTEGVLAEFVKVAGQRGQRPIVVFIPDVKDLDSYQKGTPPPYAGLIEKLRARGIEPVDVAPHLKSYLGTRSALTIYSGWSGSHFTVEGYAQVAAAVVQAIRAPEP